MKLQNLTHILIGIVCIGLMATAQAVSPPPPGGYPNFTTAAGDHALQALTLGFGNTAIGTFSLFSVTTGSFNTAVGAGALDLNTADSNTATGAAALLLNTTGTQNTAHGTAALEFNTSGNNNTANGVFALLNNTEGNENTANGTSALINNTTGDSNTAVGLAALDQNSSGVANTAVGSRSLFSSTGGFNTAIGANALNSLTSGDGNIGLGAGAGVSITTANNVICIGTVGANVDNSCFIAHIRGVTTDVSNAIPVLIDSAGQLGTMSSSKRFKKDIKPMGDGSEAILALKPVTFQYNKDKAATPQFGLIAEEVAEVNSDLVVRDDTGQIYSVRYDAVNAMLLNEFLKEHRKVEDQEASITQLKSRVAKQEATIARQQRGMDAVTARLDEQAAQLQNVSGQLAAASPSRGGVEASKPASQLVNNP
jgi:uncharacterized coiled-coil protein SlyX